MPTHLLSLDVEDWFHILDYEPTEEFRDWHALESRVEQNTRRVLDLLDETGTKCTCFVLGWIAENYPELVRELARRGHEIATHGHRHLLVYELTPQQFRDDLVASMDVIESVAGIRPVGFRAPGFSIRNDTLWALDIMVECGIQYDASLFTAARGHGGIRMDLHAPSKIQTPAGHTLAEYPTAPHHVAGVFPFPYAGGGYLRFFPSWWLERCIRARDTRGEPAVIYIHPRDFDARQPRLPGLPWHRRFKCYYGLGRTEEKVRRLLRRFQFGRIIDHTIEDVKQ